MDVDPAGGLNGSQHADDGRPFSQAAAAVTTADCDRGDKDAEMPQSGDKESHEGDSPDGKHSGVAENLQAPETTSRDQNTSESSDKSKEVMTISSDEPSQGETEESFGSAKEAEPVFVILSSSDEVSSPVSPQKRPLEAPLEPSKRARLDESFTTREESGEKGDVKEKVAVRTEKTLSIATDLPTESSVPTGHGGERPEPEVNKTAERMQVDEEDSEVARKPPLVLVSPVDSSQPGFEPSETRLSGERESLPPVEKTTIDSTGSTSPAAEQTPTESTVKGRETESTSQAVTDDADVSQLGPAVDSQSGSKNSAEVKDTASATVEHSLEVKREQIEDVEMKGSKVKSVTPGELEEKPARSADEKIAGELKDDPSFSEQRKIGGEDRQQKENPGTGQQLDENPQLTPDLPAKEKTTTAPEASRPVQRVEAQVHPEAAPLGEREFREWKKKLLDKCVEGLHMCLSRFPNHYKSIYRLAYLYYASDSHRVSSRFWLCVTVEPIS